MFQKYKRIILHFSFWISIYSIFTIYATIFGWGSFINQAIIGIFILPTDIFGVYFTIYILFPFFFKRKRYFLFGLSTLVFIIFLVFIITIPIEYYVISKLFPQLKEIGFKKFLESRFMWDIVVKSMIIGFATSIKIGKEWIKNSQKRQDLEKQKLQIELKLKEAELNFLKSQINPHFLFNAINNLYGLTRKKSNNAPDVLLKISSLLDYMLYEVKNDHIELSKEINNIQNFIDIQRLRYDDEININFNSRINQNRLYIAPLLLMPLIENCFKHGLDEQIGKASIYIDITVNNSVLTLLTKNSKPQIVTESNINSGIGLTNLKKRLQLEYKNRNSLNINETSSTFEVELKINLIENENKLYNS